MTDRPVEEEAAPVSTGVGSFLKDAKSKGRTDVGARFEEFNILSARYAKNPTAGTRFLLGTKIKWLEKRGVKGLRLPVPSAGAAATAPRVVEDGRREAADGPCACLF